MLRLPDNASVLVSALAALASAACVATPVRGDVVKAGPFVGRIAPGYDVVDGRFRLHVGPWRVRGGLTQKIPWFIPVRYRVADTLVVTGRRLDASPRTFRQTFRVALSSSTAGMHVFPSIVAPPAPGCWQLSFRSGRIAGTLIALVANSP
jgi:hypothetical protein